jgi:phage-related protein
MRKRHLQSWVAMSALTGFLCVGTPASAQSTPAQDNRPAQDNNFDRPALVNFALFLDSHHEAADQLRKQPDLVLNGEFLQSHPELQEYLQQHPGVRDQIDKNPNAFMAQEVTFEHPENYRATDRDRDADRRDLAEFDRFLDSHHETADQLRKQPDLVLNGEFLKSHPDLQEYLQQHPGVRDQLDKNPNAFMAQEANFDRRDDSGDRDMDRDRDSNRRDLAEFDRFLDSHRETAEQLRKQPDLAENGEFLKSHPALQTYLQQHPGVRDQLQQNPNAFMTQEERFDARDDNYRGDRDANHRDWGDFDRFLGSHRETAEQLRRDPNQINNDEFVKSHPDLQAYLQQHPGVRQDLSQNPNAFLQQEARYNGGENGMDRDSVNHRQFASFGEFLGGHSDVARDLSSNPSLVKNHEYLDNHPELRDYLHAHPDVQQRLTADPQNFMKSAQQFNTTTPGQTTKSPMPDANPKPKP